MLKFIHCADLHIDGQVSAGTRELSAVLKKELFSILERICAEAEKREASLVLIAGDLFDRANVSRESADAVLNCFRAHPDLDFVISPGNHDHAAEGGIYKKAEFPPNVRVFLKDEPQKISFKSLGADVYGYAFTAPTMEKYPFAGVRPEDVERINLLLAHGDIYSVLSPYCPISTKDLSESGFDYIALGHVHQSEGIEKLGQSYYGYSGTPMGHDFGECGIKGVYCCELEKEEGICRLKTEKIVISPYHFESEELDVSGCGDNESICERIEAFLKDKGYGEHTLLRLKLKGRIPIDVKVSPALICGRINGTAYLELSDGTLPLYDEKELKADPTVRGVFFEKLLPKLEEGSPEERETAALALRYGLAALSGNSLTEE